MALGAREYLPGNGAFVSPDPLLSPYDPQGLNPYAYAADSPAALSDPSGLCPVDRCGAGTPEPGGGVAGGSSPGLGGGTAGCPASEPGCPGYASGSGGSTGSSGGSSGRPWWSGAAGWFAGNAGNLGDAGLNALQAAGGAALAAAGGGADFAGAAVCVLGGVETLGAACGAATSGP